MAFYLSGSGAIALYQNQVDLCSRRVCIVVLANSPAWLMVAAFACGALALVAVIVDHYDRRRNESTYEAFRWIVIRLGWCLAAAALVTHLYLFFTGAHMPWSDGWPRRFR